MTDEQKDATTLQQTLWDLNTDLITACVDHPFVRGLGDGSLDEQAFRRYVAQDAFFLHAFAKAYALALAKSENMDQAKILHGFIGGVLDELKLHAHYASSLDIDLAAVEPYPETLAYTEFLLSKAWNADLPSNQGQAVRPTLKKTKSHPHKRSGRKSQKSAPTSR